MKLLTDILLNAKNSH